MVRFTSSTEITPEIEFSFDVTFLHREELFSEKGDTVVSDSRCLRDIFSNNM